MSSKVILEIIEKMHVAQEFLKNKSFLSDEERDLLLLCDEGFKAIENLTNLFTKYSKGLNIPIIDTSTNFEALAFGAALHDVGVFGGNNEFPIELEQQQTADFEEFLALSDCPE